MQWVRCLGPKNENGLRGKIEQLNNLESGNHFDAVPISGIREDKCTTKKKDQCSHTFDQSHRKGSGNAYVRLASVSHAAI